MEGMEADLQVKLALVNTCTNSSQCSRSVLDIPCGKGVDTLAKHEVMWSQGDHRVSATNNKARMHHLEAVRVHFLIGSMKASMEIVMGRD